MAKPGWESTHYSWYRNVWEASSIEIFIRGKQRHISSTWLAGIYSIVITERYVTACHLFQKSFEKVRVSWKNVKFLIPLFSICLPFQNCQSLQEFYIGNNTLANIREVYNLKVKKEWKHSYGDVVVFAVNPWTPQSDWHLLSPYNITPKSRIKLMRLKEMITK